MCVGKFILIEKLLSQLLIDWQMNQIAQVLKNSKIEYRVHMDFVCTKIACAIQMLRNIYECLV